MIFFNNLLFIHQLLFANTGSEEGDDGSEYVYTEEELEYDVEHLLDGPKQESDKRCARIVKYLKDLNYQTLGKDLERCNRYMNEQRFNHEYSKAIQFVYKAEKFSLYFSAQQEGNVEPREGLKVFINETKIEMMKGVFKELDRVYLTVVVRSSSRNLSDVDLGDTIQQFDSITDLYLLNLTHEYASWDCVSYNTVQDFISLETIPRLRTLKVKHMLVTDEFLEKVSNMTLESLWFTGCVFLIFKDTVQQLKELKVTFAKSYETICFSKCWRSSYYPCYPVNTKSVIIKINLNKCTKLCNLTVNMDKYASVVLSDQIVSDPQYLSLGEKYCEQLLSSSQCYGARLEYLVINTWDLEIAIKFLKEINRSKLKHLILIYFSINLAWNVCRVFDIFLLDFAALEILEIDAGGNDLELKDKSTIEVKMKKLETLRINCWCVDKEIMQMITELEMLKHLEILVKSWDVKYELLRRQLSSLKGPIEKLFVNSKLTISELVRSIEPLNKLKEFYVDGRSIRSSFNSLTNRNYGIYKPVKICLNKLKRFVTNSRFIRSSFDSLTNRNDGKHQPAKVDVNKRNLVKSKNMVHLKLHTLHIGIDSAYEELIELMLCQYFEAFAGIKKLVIFEAPTDSWTRLEKIQKLSEISPDQLNNLIENIFETFKQLDVLVFCYKSSYISREEAHILREFFSSRCRSLKERCEWLDKCNEEQTIFELYK
ncbi:hypothetical protein VCUG_01603 [Vavraia culicis subsp. floridensis]|uniref:Uncharacterized protein n=1 Tax=Vavraia culicis (isolate floridensis) TaxID=948595 RepID=L2GUZ9_VAVCU|nr:uncharacterized protein VCUG_01603 [Vavraia culicis subsp. floridensis]ELA46905.1 hypothetical protein VCUG_01603 [Vavraia culicis subsp. floridensis]